MEEVLHASEGGVGCFNLVFCQMVRLLLHILFDFLGIIFLVLLQHLGDKLLIAGINFLVVDLCAVCGHHPIVLGNGQFFFRLLPLAHLAEVPFPDNNVTGIQGDHKDVVGSNKDGREHAKGGNRHDK
eukprot:Lithocolla_globosa_v1_NODE_1153_length_2830_cov_7.182342.p2 type:complete len:127 gc:universal NODE_1153_length_2830_cov_7.182342:1315-1695(+)